MRIIVITINKENQMTICIYKVTSDHSLWKKEKRLCNLSEQAKVQEVIGKPINDWPMLIYEPSILYQEVKGRVAEAC